MFKHDADAFLVIIGARNNDQRRVWSKDDRRVLEAALANCKIAGWTYIRADGIWGGAKEQSRVILICGRERQVYKAVNQVAATFQQNQMLVVRLNGAHFYDTTKLKTKTPATSPRITPRHREDVQ